MRFGVPKSRSPSPERQKTRQKSITPAPSTQRRRSGTYGLVSDSDESPSDLDAGKDTSQQATSQSPPDSSDSDSFGYDSEKETVSQASTSRKLKLTPAQLARSDRDAATIRLHASYADTYEEWQRELRSDSFRQALSKQSPRKLALQSKIEQAYQTQTRGREEHNQRNATAVNTLLSDIQKKTESEEQKIRKLWAEQEAQILLRIQSAIEVDEKHHAEELAKEQRKKEAEESKRKALEEAKQKADEERRVQEEKEKAEKAQRDADAQELAQKAAADKKLAEDRAAAERRAADEREAQAKIEEERKKSLSTPGSPLAEWTEARTVRLAIKTGPLLKIKSNPKTKSFWGGVRRQMRTRIGQLVNDAQTIDRITTQLYTLLKPEPHAPAHEPDMYISLLSALAKAIIAQAEVEVVAKAAAAHPLGIVLANLLRKLPDFPKIFWARFVQKTGGWAFPMLITPTTQDANKIPFNGPSLRHAQGYADEEEGEQEEEYASRVAAILRVYYEAICAPGPKMDEPMYQFGRIWIWLARCANGSQELLDQQVVPTIIGAIISISGPHGKRIWGKQFGKMVNMLARGLKSGVNGHMIGGATPEANASRVRAQLEIDKIL